MITSEGETKKRLEIIDYIKGGLEEIAECMVLGGSMGYGQNYSVAPWCDIDTVLVIKKEKVSELMKHPYFNQTVGGDVVRLFLAGEIDYFWSSRTVSGVDVDIFVYDKESFTEFCLLRKELRGFIKLKPESTQDAFNFEGKKITFDRDVSPYKDGFIYVKPALNNGKYWGGVPRDDFLFIGYVVFDNNYFQNLSKEVWNALIAQLKKEHGPTVNLSKYNLLNTVYTFQTNRKGLPEDIINKITSETKRLLGK